jgi:purine-binding chemotaxis protein CheW
MAETSPLLQPHVLFYLGSQCFALPLSAVKDVKRAPAITRLPHIPSMLAGITVMRGELAAAIDLAACLKIPLSSSEKTVALSIAHDGEHVAFLVDRLEDVLSLPVRAADTIPEHLKPTVNGVMMRADAKIYVLDPTAIIDLITLQ